MNVEILYIEDCPNWAETAVRVGEAIEGLGLPMQEIVFQKVASPAEAARTVFAGSPTIVVNGRDLFPDGVPTRALLCRAYRRESGFSGSPSRIQIMDAILARL